MSPENMRSDHTGPIYVTRPSDNDFSEGIVRVDPNSGFIPEDATIRVYAEDNQILEFKFGSEPVDNHSQWNKKHWLIFLTDARPPLEGQSIGEREYWVKEEEANKGKYEGEARGIIVKGRTFELATFEEHRLRKTGFTAVRITSNILIADMPFVDKDMNYQKIDSED